MHISDMAERGAGWRFGALALGVFGALAWAERRRALRGATEDKQVRAARNVAVAGLAAAAVQLAERPVVRPIARRVGERRMGLLYWLQDRLSMSDAVRDALAVVLMDYTLYWWHVAEHRVRALYRFHVVHHADLDLDASTALRFHFGELLASIPWRAAQVALIGVSPRALGAWQKLTTLSVMFHHSNVRLPAGLERWLGQVVMTPRLHGIHHSVVPEEQGSNWSSGLTLWDRLHGSYRADVPQEEIAIGVAAFREPAQVSLPKIVAMPFVAQPPLDRFPDGARPVRAPRLARPAASAL
jgi:sterol desaturase/sphingolipid hydroxylase (fatty acid hydroxylase superfamily)